MVTVEEALPLPDHAEDGVVHNHDLYVDIVVRHRCELLTVHHDAAVARDKDDLTLGTGEFRTDRCRQTVTHRAESARGEETARLVAVEELCRPHLMLPHIRHTNRIRIDEFAHAADEPLGTDGLRCLPPKRMRALH